MAPAEAPVLAFVLGPTGSGKSALAVALAERFHGEIVNCDSIQLYRRLDIGAAKTTLEERRGIPHHLLDALDPNQVFSAGEFARQAKQILYDIRDRGRLPILAGGTGFYVRALTDGLFAGPPRDENLRQDLVRREGRRSGLLHRFLRRLDPASAHRIHPNDVQKTVRAVEVCLRSRQAMSRQFGYTEEPLTGFRFVKFGLSPHRELLYARINRRCERMLELGLRREVEALVADGYGEHSKALESIGYKQMIEVLSGRLTEAEALESIRVETRHYAKRQLTWFRRDPDIHWLSGFGDDHAIQQQAIAILQPFVP